MTSLPTPAQKFGPAGRCRRSATRFPGQARERGVTLVELMIAISLVAILSAGLLVAMRTTVSTYDRVNLRLNSNRRAMNIQQILMRQLASAMPVAGLCPVSDSTKSATEQRILDGTETTLRLVTSYSIAAGARGNPQIVEYEVQPLQGGGVRLMVAERPYTGPASTAPYCQDNLPRPVNLGSQGMAIEDKLAFCRFSFHPPYNPLLYRESAWEPAWHRPVLPAAVRLDLKPAQMLPGTLPVLAITAPIRVDRSVFAQYDDRY